MGLNYMSCTDFFLICVVLFGGERFVIICPSTYPNRAQLHTLGTITTTKLTPLPLCAAPPAIKIIPYLPKVSSFKVPGMVNSSLNASSPMTMVTTSFACSKLLLHGVSQDLWQKPQVSSFNGRSSGGISIDRRHPKWPQHSVLLLEDLPTIKCNEDYDFHLT